MKQKKVCFLWISVKVFVLLCKENEFNMKIPTYIEMIEIHSILKLSALFGERFGLNLQILFYIPWAE